MPKLDIHSLSEISETLLIPLYFRALESKEPDPIVFDKKALALVDQIDYNFSEFDNLRSDRVFSMIRCREFDRCAQAFLSAHPSGIVIEIGCGFGDRASRMKEKSVKWYNLDLPEVISIRRQLYGESDKAVSIACSAFDPSWLKLIEVPSGEQCLILAEGVLSYFDEVQVRQFVMMLRDAFPGCELVFDKLSSFVVRMHKQESYLMNAAALIRWTPAHDRDLEQWGDTIHFIDRWGYFDRPEPRIAPVFLTPLLKPLSRGVGVLRYQLGVSSGIARTAGSSISA